jgi:hypothetical protein
VICNSQNDSVNKDRRSCKNAPGSNGQPRDQVGEVHVRYDCGERTFWVLSFVYSNYTFDQTTDDMWAVNRCVATPSSSGSCAPPNQNNKFMQVSVCDCTGVVQPGLNWV